jgi:two-component system cell cycle response regulator
MIKQIVTVLLIEDSPD